MDVLLTNVAYDIAIGVYSYIYICSKKENIIKLYLNSLKGGLSQSVYAPDIAPWNGSCTLISSAQSVC